MKRVKRKKEMRNIFLRYFGLQRCYIPKFLIKNSHCLYDKVVADLIVSKFFNFEDFTFLQVDGYDGLSNDIIKPLMNRISMRGVIAEPQSNVYDSLKESYNNYENISVIDSGVSDSDCVREFYQTNGYSSQVCSLNKEHLLKHKIPIRDIISTKVKFLTIKSIIDIHKLGDLNLLQVDAEGHDFRIIKSIDFDVLKPQIIRFESDHMSNVELNEILGILAFYNYKFYTESRDITAIL